MKLSGGLESGNDYCSIKSWLSNTFLTSTFGLSSKIEELLPVDNSVGVSQVAGGLILETGLCGSALKSGFSLTYSF